MLRRITIQLPHEWYAALEAERDKLGRTITDLLRHMVRRSIGARGYSLKHHKIASGLYEGAEKGLLGAERQREHELREKNRQRVRRQLERKRLERDRSAFVPAYQFDPTGGVWTPDYGDEVAVIGSGGELRIL